MNKKQYLLFSTALFLVAECVLGVLLHLLSGAAVTWCSYAAVLLALGFSLLLFTPTPACYLTEAALLATAAADWFLVVRGAREQFVAMLFFSVTQLCYFARLYLTDECKKRRTVHVFLRIGVPLLTLAITLAVLGRGADRVAMISMFYFANLLLNVVFALLGGKRAPLFAIGLLLFACCDVFIGLSLIEGYLPLTEGSLIYRLAHPGFNLAWVFYVPSQALIALSLLPYKIKK